jgi:DNA-binding ferritin-like protein
MEKQQLIDRIEQLEKKLDVHWNLWGPACYEVAELKSEIYEANMQLLDIISEEVA